MDERERTEESRAVEERMREYQAACVYAFDALLAAYPCSKCGSREPQDGRQFFTARTYRRVPGLGAMVVCISRAAVERAIAKQGHVVLCEPCFLKLRYNGSGPPSPFRLPRKKENPDGK